MSTLESQVEIEYPESDGQPMGETDWHIKAMNRLSDMLRRKYRDEKVYVGSNLLVYYVEGEPRRFVVPDVFVVLDCDPSDRRTFKIWEEHRTPDVVFEITSRSTARDDQESKPKTYSQIGVKEYFLFDPTGEYLVPRLQGFRFLKGSQIPIESRSDQFRSDILGVNIAVAGKHLRLVDLETLDEVLTGEEFERRAKEAERKAKESERIAKEAERRARELEHQARIAAEAECERLRAELESLRRKQRDA